MMDDTEHQFFTEPDLDESADPRVKLALTVLKQVQDSLQNVVSLLESGATEDAESLLGRLETTKQVLDAEVAEATGVRVVEGVFDGCHMVGQDGKVYSVPPNYASKSRLVEGDLLKLMIKKDGTFVYKQIGPIDRSRVVAVLGEDEDSGEYCAVGPEEKVWKLIRASVTYYRGAPGDEVVVLVPRNAPSTWAAVENIVKK